MVVAEIVVCCSFGFVFKYSKYCGSLPRVAFCMGKPFMGHLLSKDIDILTQKAQLVNS
jgi:hypothetical protein